MRALIFLLVTVIAGISFISLGIKTNNMNARFDGPVTRVIGKIDDIVEAAQPSGTSIGRRQDRPRFVMYHYDAPDGPHTANDLISLETSRVLHTSHAIPIKYLSSNPAECRIDLPNVDAGYHVEVWIDYIVGVFLLAVGCIAYGKSHHRLNA